MPEGPREWVPKLDESTRQRLQSRIVRILNEVVGKQRRITGYEGPDEGFAQFVADNPWDWEFLDTVFNSGYLHALLDFAKMLHIELPKEIAERAERHINEGPSEP